jgi:dTDP-4-dehydrorhamnose 3,5-epimerase
MPFRLVKTPLSGLLIIEPTIFSDSRGYFLESYRKKDFENLGINVEFIQDNQSKSKKGTLRGLHFQVKHPQAKLVQVLSGKVFDVAVDIRKSSPTFGKSFGLVLDDESKRQFYIPTGFAHGFLTVSDEAVFAYKCSDYYHQEDEGGILWNDPDLNIGWPPEWLDHLILSDKDKKLPRLREVRFSFQ